MASFNQREDQIPKFRFIEIFRFWIWIWDICSIWIIEFCFPVLNLIGQNKWKIIKDDLNKQELTVTKPVEPQKPSFSNSYDSGRRKFSASLGSSFNAATHWLYSFSLATATLTSIFSSSSLFLITLMFWKRGWLILVNN